MTQLKDTAISVLDLAPVRDDGNAAQALHNSLDLARHAERLGYNRFWVAEHHNMDGIASSATAVLLGYLAGGTSTIRIGSGGIMLPNHAPLVVADVEELQYFLGPRQEEQRVIAVPGVDSNIPIWLLGSSLFSAQLAAAKGLPYAFASHFAPRYMHEAIRLYRENFRPSEVLDKPYVMLGVPLVAADSDEEANYLASTVYQRVLALMRGQSLVLRPPVRNMSTEWLPHEKDAVLNMLGMAIIGGPDKVRERVDLLLEKTDADELIFTCDVYEHADRLKSYQILAELKG